MSEFSGLGLVIYEAVLPFVVYLFEVLGIRRLITNLQVR
jgi:hypothetical protein